MSDPIRPKHYHRDSGHEVLEVIEAWGLGFILGNVVKYVARAGHKGDELTDLRKAREYLDRRIAKLELPSPSMMLGWRGIALCAKCHAPAPCQTVRTSKTTLATVCFGCLEPHRHKKGQKCERCVR